MRWTVLVLALTAAVLAQQPQAEKVDFSAVPTLGDKYRAGLPFPVTVRLKNLQAEPLDVRVVAQTFTAPAEGPSGETRLTLAAGSRHAAQVLLPHGSYSPSVFLEINGKRGPNVPFSSNFADNQDVITLLLTPTATGLDYLGGYSKLLNGGEWRTSRPDALANLPTCWQALAGIDQVVLFDRPNLHLAPAAEQALADWTRAGGALVVVSNLDPGEYRGSPLQELLPLASTRLQTTDTRSYLAGTLREARVLLEEEGHPLVVAGRREAGQVFLITTPVLTQDTLGNRLTEEVWAYLLHEFRFEASPLRAHRFDENTGLLARPPELPMPSAGTLSWYLIGYVLLVGPVNYGLLRRKDRMLWIVFTVPAIAVSFSAGAYFTNAWSRSSHTVVREVGLLHLQANSRHAVLDGHLMVFSPRSRRYELESPVTCYGRPRGTPNSYGYSSDDLNYRLEQVSAGLRLRDFTASMWSARHFRSFEVRELPGPVQWNSGGRLQSPVAVGQACLVDGGLSESFAVSANQPVRVPSAGSSLGDPNARAAALSERLRASLPADSAWSDDLNGLAQLVTQNYEPCLVGLTQEDWTSGLRLNDSKAIHHRLTLVVVHPEPEFQPPAPVLAPKPSPGATP